MNQLVNTGDERPLRPMSTDHHNHKPPTASLAQYSALIWRGKYWLMLFALLGATAAFIFALLQPPVYQAMTTLELQGFNEAFMGMSAVDPLAGTGNYSVNQSNINTQIRIIESASVRTPVIERLSRETTPTLPPSKSRLDKIRQTVRHQPMDPLNEMHDALGMAAGTVKARSIMSTRIISISCESTIPEIASAFVNSVALEYIAQNSQQRSATTQKTSQWLESQLEETKVKLEQAESRLEAFVKQAGIVFSGEQESRNVLSSARLQSLTNDLAAIQQERIAKQTKFNALNEMIKRGSPELVPEIGENLYLRDLEGKLADARKRRGELLLKFTPTNPKVLPEQRLIEELQNTIAAERGKIIQRLRNDYEQALARESALKSAYATEAATLTSQQDKVATYNLLKREVTLYQQGLNMMLQQANQASVVAAVPANNVRVIDVAAVPGTRIKPNLSYSLFIGNLIGGILGAAFLVTKDKHKKQKQSARFGVPGVAPTLLAVPELGVIPSADIDGTDTGLIKRLRLRPGRLSINVLTATGEAGTYRSLDNWQSDAKPSFLAESFRLTMTSLLLMFRTPPRVIVVTSPGPGEGKTTISANLAMAMAETGKRVVLVDLDLRRPQLHVLFGLSNEHGFSDLVRGNGRPDLMTAEDRVVQQSRYAGVSLVASGQIESKDIGATLHSPRVPALLRELKERYDVVIIDTAPMLHFSDTRLLGSFADGVILVLRSGQTDKDTAVAARQQLEQDGIQLLGTVLNDWTPAEDSASAAQYRSYYGAYVKRSGVKQD